MDQPDQVAQQSAADNKPEMVHPARTPPRRADSTIEVKLDRIIQQLQVLTRLREHREFSLPRLIAAIAQLLVIGLLIWTVVFLVDLTDINLQTSTLLKLFGAILLQLIALTFFILDHQDR